MVRSPHLFHQPYDDDARQATHLLAPKNVGGARAKAMAKTKAMQAEAAGGVAVLGLASVAGDCVTLHRVG